MKNREEEEDDFGDFVILGFLCVKVAIPESKQRIWCLIVNERGRSWQRREQEREIEHETSEEEGTGMTGKARSLNWWRRYRV